MMPTSMPVSNRQAGHEQKEGVYIRRVAAQSDDAGRVNAVSM